MSRLEEEETEEDSKEESKIIFLDSPSGGPDDPKIRKCMLYGDINEQQAKDLIATMILLADTAETQELEDPEDPESEIKTTVRPFEMVISTGGGNADDMMSVYDMMRLIRETVDIETTGIGRVMSAGTLLLAAGTKGQRRVGRNCRVMIHAVSGGSIGPMHEITNEFKEIKKIQESYINCLADETNMTTQQIKKYLKQKTNVYLSAEEAVKLGIADEIF
jgi:ATP-dependent Clp protease protease subunit|tara:strand:- start:376 stop:1032 length:657 start_codon:yes stop_codon:yes gene_type:complete